MELVKQSFLCYQTVLDAVSAPEISADMIVPDQFPDMERIVDSTGLACIKETAIREDRLDLTGLAKVSVLYQPDGEEGLRKLDVSIPFNHVFDGQFPPGSEAHPDVRLLEVETRAVNPRKIAVLARLCVRAVVYAPDEFSVPSDTGEACEVKRHSCKAYLATSAVTRRFTVDESVEIAASRPAAEEIVSALPRLEVVDVKVVGSKAVVKGAAYLSVLYLNGGEPYHTEHEFSLSQIIDMEGLEENSDVDIDLRVTGIELDTAASGGEPRALTISLHLEAQAVARTERQFEAIVDLYSTTSSLKPLMEPLFLTELSGRGISKQPVRETIECESDVRNVVYTRVTPGSVTRLENGETGCDVFANMLYITEEGELRSQNRKISVSAGTENASIIPKEAAEITAAPSSDGIELRFNLSFAAISTTTTKLLVIGGIQENEAADRAVRPGVVLRRCHSGEGFWEIAKHYNTTVAELCTANGLEGCEEAPCGQLLLIPKKR
jgi:hypothetical protein